MTKNFGELRRLFRPRAIAVYGASTRGGKAGNAMLASLRSFKGPVVAVNPGVDGGDIDGRPACASLAEAEAEVDLAIFCVPPGAVTAAMEDCAKNGVGGVVICTGGMGESGPDGLAVERRLGEIAGGAGIRVLGPNTSGFLAPGASLVASFVSDTDRVPGGSIGVVAQSGGVNHALAFAIANQGHGVSLAVGLGNAIDVDAAAVVDHLCDDPHTAAIALHLEGVRDGRQLFAAVRRATARKAVVAINVGRAEIGEFATSHTGAMIGSWALTRAAMRQAGAVVVDDTQSLVDAALVLAAGRIPPSAEPGLALVTGQAGPGLLIADSLRAAGETLPELAAATSERLTELLPPITFQRNPVDTGRPGPSFADVIATTAKDPAIDVVAVYALHEPAALDAGAVLGTARAQGGKPLLFVTDGPDPLLEATIEEVRAAGVPALRSPERGARALAALAEDARRRHALAADDGPADLGPRRERPAARSLDEDAAKDMLDRVGVRTMERRTCDSPDAVLAALDELGSPVVVKALDPQLTHKSDVGGVHVGVVDEKSARRAITSIDAASSSGRYLVEAQAGPGPELIVGAKFDSSFGPTVLLGLGGVEAEAIADVSMRLAPLSAAEAATMVEDLRGKALLRGFRGGPTVDGEELAATIAAVAGILVTDPTIAEIEINPLRLTATGLMALDALVYVTK